jgi:Fic family protein
MGKFMKWVENHLPVPVHPVQFAAMLHFKLVYVHPFEDANGRTGRVLMNLFLHKAGYPMVGIEIIL